MSCGGAARSTRLATGIAVAPGGTLLNRCATRSSRDQANLLSQVVAKRYERGSIVLTSNLTFSTWDCTLLDDAVLTTAVLDRLMRHVTVVQIGGDRYRLRDKRKGGVVSKARAGPV